jgi:hypothetical protein
MGVILATQPDVEDEFGALTTDGMEIAAKAFCKGEMLEE